MSYFDGIDYGKDQIGANDSYYGLNRTRFSLNPNELLNINTPLKEYTHKKSYERISEDNKYNELLINLRSHEYKMNQLKNQLKKIKKSKEKTKEKKEVETFSADLNINSGSIFILILIFIVYIVIQIQLHNVNTLLNELILLNIKGKF